MKPSTIQGAKIISTGSAIPNYKLTNQQISSIVETSDEWIFTRTGIKERRVLINSGESVVNLGKLASLEALTKVSMNPLEIDLIILATSSPNNLFGSASEIQYEIGAFNALAFDLTAACSGFVLGIVTASQFLFTKTYRNILVIGADVLSKWIDWSDRSTCILFGDAAGAVVIQSCNNLSNSILGFDLNTDGSYSSCLSIPYKDDIKVHPNFNFHQGSFKYLSMNGKEVYKFAVSQVPMSILKCLDDIDMSIEEVDWLLLHQANKRILTAVADKLSISHSKIISNLSNYGNTSAASIPLALDEAVQQNKIANNSIIVISGFGAGLTWGTVIIRW
uniref:Beta-ketoacyl-[acyl-carrier-protein] synthase III n=1 Tax=Polysiphonia sertularioides TaxID=945028 RepID=A0A1Z1MGK1_9FLOR|nr:Beta-ketoacyl-acyl carrier protein synthase III [Polysiphonia sertularioides]